MISLTDRQPMHMCTELTTAVWHHKTWVCVHASVGTVTDQCCQSKGKRDKLTITTTEYNFIYLQG